MPELNDISLLRQACHINGEWIGADSGERIAVVNPATGQVVAHVPRCAEAETTRPIELPHHLEQQRNVQEPPPQPQGRQ